MSLDIITDANGGITDAKGCTPPGPAPDTPTPTPPADARGFVGMGCETGDAAVAVRCKDKDQMRVNKHNSMAVVTFFLLCVDILCAVVVARPLRVAGD